MAIKIESNSFGTVVSSTNVAEFLDGMFGPCQHDCHVQAYKAFVTVYGGIIEGWYARQVERQASTDRLKQTAKGREFTERLERKHEAWRKQRGM